MEKIIVSSGGINWCWYTQYSKLEDGTYAVDWSDRFHKFNEAQGSGSHPHATHTLHHSYAPAADWKRGRLGFPKEWIEREDNAFIEKCKEVGADPAATSSIQSITDIYTGERVAIAVGKKG